METCSCPIAVPAPVGAEVLTLRENTLHALTPLVSRRITVLRGSAWITETGNPCDVVLRSGESCVPTRGRKVVIQPLTRSATIQIARS